METTTLYPMLLERGAARQGVGRAASGNGHAQDLPTGEPYGEVVGDARQRDGRQRRAGRAHAGRSAGGIRRRPDRRGKRSGGRNATAGQAARRDDWLSVQVHPNDEQARELEGEPRGKTEAWYVIAAEPDAATGDRRGPDASREEIADAIRANRLEEMLVYEPVEAGRRALHPCRDDPRAGSRRYWSTRFNSRATRPTACTTGDGWGWTASRAPCTSRKGWRSRGWAACRRSTLSAAMRDTAVSVVESPFFRTVLHQLRRRSGRSGYGGAGFSRADLHRREARRSTSRDSPALPLETGTDGVHPGGDRALHDHGDGKDSTLVSDMLKRQQTRKVLPTPSSLSTSMLP